jgi:hypothetical protein
VRQKAIRKLSAKGDKNVKEKRERKKERTQKRNGKKGDKKGTRKNVMQNGAQNRNTQGKASHKPPTKK